MRRGRGGALAGIVAALATLVVAALLAPEAARADLGAAMAGPGAGARQSAGGRSLLAEVEAVGGEADSSEATAALTENEIKAKFQDFDLAGAMSRRQCMRKQKAIDKTARKYHKFYKKQMKKNRINSYMYKQAKTWVEKEHLYASAKLSNKCQQFFAKGKNEKNNRDEGKTELK